MNKIGFFSLRNVKHEGDRQARYLQDTKGTWGSAHVHMGAIVEYDTRRSLLSTERIRKVPQLISSVTLCKSFNLAVPHFLIYITWIKKACVL